MKKVILLISLLSSTPSFAATFLINETGSNECAIKANGLCDAQDVRLKWEHASNVCLFVKSGGQNKAIACNGKNGSVSIPWISAASSEFFIAPSATSAALSSFTMTGYASHFQVGTSLNTNNSCKVNDNGVCNPQTLKWKVPERVCLFLHNSQGASSPVSCPNSNSGEVSIPWITEKSAHFFLATYSTSINGGYTPLKIIKALSIKGFTVTQGAIDPRNFGNCNWTVAGSDVTSCIQEAINASSNQTVLIPKGQFSLSAPLRMKSTVSLSGHGPKTILQSSKTTVPANSTLFIVGDSNNNYSLKHITFDGNNAACVGQSCNGSQGIKISNSSAVVIDGIELRNLNSLGMSVIWSSNMTLKNSRFVNIGNYWRINPEKEYRKQGVVFYGQVNNSNNKDSSNWAQNNQATNNYFEDIGLDPLQFTYQKNYLAQGNIFNLNQSQHANHYPDHPTAIFPFYSREGIIQYNAIFSTPGCGIDAPGIEHLTIANNLISHAGECGVGLFDSESYGLSWAPKNITLSSNIIVNVAQSKNTIYWCGAVSVKSQGSENIVLSKNKIIDLQNPQTSYVGVQAYHSPFACSSLSLQQKVSATGGIRIEGDNQFSGMRYGITNLTGY